MAYGELTLPPVRSTHNKQNGRFLKGHTPWNKGKKWSECFGERAQKRMARGWKNLDKYRPKERPDNAGRCRKQVIAVLDDGKWLYFSYLGAAAKWCGGLRENVGRCCRLNAAKKVCKIDWRPYQKKGASRINTDHRYKGVRFYFEDDNIWTTKVKQL